MPSFKLIKRRLHAALLAWVCFLAPVAYAELDCSGLTDELQAEGRPGQAVELPGVLPTEHLALRLRDGGQSVVLLGQPSLALDTENLDAENSVEGVWMVAPWHPRAPLEGGPVELELKDASTSCVMSWRISSVDPSPGSSRRVVALLRARLQMMVAQVSVDSAALFEAPLDSLPAHVAPVAAMARVLGRQGSPQSLEVKIDALAPESLAWLDSLLGNSGIETELASTPTESAALRAWVAPLGPRAVVRVASTPSTVGAGEKALPPQSRFRDAKSLAKAMTEANSAKSRLSGAVGKVFNDLGLGVVSIAAIPHPVAQTIGGLAAAVHYFGKTMIELNAYLLPTKFTSLDLELTRSSWNHEDDGTTTTWKSALASVASDAWQLHWKAYDTLGQVAGPAGLPVIGSRTDLSANLLDRPEVGPTPETLTLGPLAWSGIDMRDADLVDLEPGGAAAATKVLRQKGPAVLEPINAGTGVARLAIKPGVFGSASGVTFTTTPVSVAAIDVSVEMVSGPSILPADETAEACASATVAHAKDNSLRFTISGQGVDFTVDAEAGTRVCFDIPIRVWKAHWHDCEEPEKIKDDVFDIHVESLAEKTGPRAKGDPAKRRPPREDRTQLSVKRTLDVEPRPEECGLVSINSYPHCVIYGESAQLAVSDNSLPITWEAESGSISQSGAFVAPASGDYATVSAYPTSQTSAGDSVTFRVSETCECSVTLAVTGAETMAYDKMTWWLAQIERRGAPWITLQGNKTSFKTGVKFVLFLGFPQSWGVGTHPLYTEGFNHLDLGVPGGGYSAFGSNELGRSAGTLHIMKRGDGWFEARTNGLLSDKETGASINVDLRISVPWPPSRCP